MSSNLIRRTRPGGHAWRPTPAGSRPNGWYLAAWCRLRSAVRGFQLDRITSVEPSDEHAATREPHWRAELNRLDAEPFAR
ncbi:WYL domain-containing protein [Streptomyces sp. NPDC056264]|uniref:WYL domain-containing protein n=1 Tax=Streptomyces sp. NPDC056264 TaxID=3345767 RepID=UPI003AAB88C2